MIYIINNTMIFGLFNLLFYVGSYFVIVSHVYVYMFITHTESIQLFNEKYHLKENSFLEVLVLICIIYLLPYHRYKLDLYYFLLK